MKKEDILLYDYPAIEDELCEGRITLRQPLSNDEIELLLAKYGYTDVLLLRSEPFYYAVSKYQDGLSAKDAGYAYWIIEKDRYTRGLGKAVVYYFKVKGGAE